MPTFVHNGREYLDPLDVLEKIWPLIPKSIESYIGCIMVFQTNEKEGVGFVLSILVHWLHSDIL